MILIGVSGKAKAGKDTFARFFMFHYAVQVRKKIFGNKFGTGPMYQSMAGVELGSGFEVKKFAHLLKKVASLFLNVPIDEFESQEFKDSTLGAQWGDMTVREFLQKLGTDAIRLGLHNDAWVNALFSTYSFGSRWIVTDVRFPNEATAIKEHGGKLIRMERPGIELMDHPSETALDDWKDWDLVINNDKGLDKFEAIVSDYVYETYIKNSGN